MRTGNAVRRTAIETCVTDQGMFDFAAAQLSRVLLFDSSPTGKFTYPNDLMLIGQDEGYPKLVSIVTDLISAAITVN
jgi:hypothetical protein